MFRKQRTTATQLAATPSDNVSIHRADGEADAYYLQRQQHHWFGSEYDSQQSLQLDYFDIAGWDYPDDYEGTPPLESVGFIAEHTRDDRSVRVGGGVALLLDHEATTDELPAGTFDPAALAGEPSVWFLIGVVDQGWRGRGIGRRLFERRLQWARQTDAEIALAMGWERDGRSSRPLFEANGWVPVETIDAMYTDSARSACPDCGVWPSDDRACQCDATVWALDL